MKNEVDGYHCAVCRDQALATQRAERTKERAFCAETAQQQNAAMLTRQQAHEDECNRRWEEKQAEEQRRQVTVTLRIGVFFDGTGNNPFNVELGQRCGAHHPIAPQDLQGSCKPYMQDPSGSYGNEVTNVKRLHDLYLDSRSTRDIKTQMLAFKKVYVEGIGTTAGEQDSLLGSALGRGETGIEARVFQAFREVNKQIWRFHDENPELQIHSLIFDIFGFSRGAAAARHFAYLTMARIGSPLHETLALPKKFFANGFSKIYGESVHTGFIGLFDTVASVGGWSNLGYVRSPAAPGVKLHLPPKFFPHVLHLVARDEHRANFGLNRLGPDHTEISLPGAHSDLGGGYRDEAEERVMLIPLQALDVPVHTDVKTTSIYRDAQRAQATWHAKGWPLDMLRLVTPEPELLPADSQDRMAPKHKRVFVGLLLQRKVSAGLAKVYLRVMYEAAKKHGVQFEEINERPGLRPPSELQTLCDRFISGDYSMTPAEEKLLRHRYIHRSAHWTPGLLAGPRTSKLELIYVNAPTADAVRVQHPHVPEWML